MIRQTIWVCACIFAWNFKLTVGKRVFNGMLKVKMCGEVIKVKPQVERISASEEIEIG